MSIAMSPNSVSSTRAKQLAASRQSGVVVLAVLATLLLTALDVRFASTGNSLSQAEAAIGITQPE
jgi:hypothetical protein